MSKEAIDYSKKENQIGCGYCTNERSCEQHQKSRMTNFAKLGCKYFIHFSDIPKK